LIANEDDPQEAAAKLLQHALSNFSTDNTSVLVVKFGLDAATIGTSTPKEAS
jgi:serine/threonine protein phosphatase PrpC